MSNQPGGPRQPNQPFQEGGEWRSYDDAGRLLRWDERLQTWVPITQQYNPPPAQTQVAGMPPGYAQPGQPGFGAPAQPGYGAQMQPGYGAMPARFSSLKTPAIWVYVTLGFAIVAAVISLVGAAMQVSALRELQDENTDKSFFELLQDVEDADDVVTAGGVVNGFATLACAIVFIWWLRRATCNVPALGAANPEFSPGWSIGWWFIPFANLVQPLRVVNQAWRASDPTMARSNDPYAWRLAAVGGIVIAWWLTWIATGVAGAIVSGVYEEADALDTLERAATAMAVLEAATIGAAVLAILVVRKLTARHDMANSLRTAGAQQL